MIRPVRYRWEFELLRDAGRYRRSGPISVRSCASDGRRDAADRDDVRIGYAIGRRVGSAVVRNRLRRRLRHVATELDADGRVQPGLYLVIASPHAASATFDELHHSLSDLLVVQ